MPFGIVARPRVTQHDQASRFQEANPTVVRLPRTLWRLIAIEQQQVYRRAPGGGNVGCTPLMYHDPIAKTGPPNVGRKMLSERSAVERAQNFLIIRDRKRIPRAV